MAISSFETLTADAERKISIAVPLLEAIFADALIVVCSTVDFCATSLPVTTTSATSTAASFKRIVPRSICALLGTISPSYFS